MIGDYSAEIEIAIFPSVWKRQRDEWRSSYCGWQGNQLNLRDVRKRHVEWSLLSDQCFIIIR